MFALLFLTASACEDQTVDPGPTIPDAPAAAPSTKRPAAAVPADDEEPLPPDPFPEPKAPATPAAGCAKQLTVVLTDGVTGMSKIKTNGCWKPVITDGAANNQYRKCSTSTFKVTNNPAAPNWAYDDTNPTHATAKEKTFFDQCADGATGDGYVFMAYNTSWRILTAPSMKALFAELYTSQLTDIDSHYATPSRYTTNAQIMGRTDIYPMMNFGPPASANLEKKVGTEAAKLCKTVKDAGYFGLYNASWQDGMEADDPRLLAVEQALDACTAAPAQ